MAGMGCVVAGVFGDSCARSGEALRNEDFILGLSRIMKNLGRKYLIYL
jgi:hypothetical protein